MANTTRCIEGTHRPHDKPVAVVVIDDDAELRAVLPTMRPMIAQGIVVLTDAEVIPLS
jgi:PII-like signaling protein